VELNLDTERSRAVWQVFADVVEDGPVIKSIHNKDMKVTRVRFDYTPHRGEWKLHGIELMGMRINSDGLPGRREDTNSYFRIESAPAWAHKAAEHYRPKGHAGEAPIPLCVLDVEE
jgi:hypothetical protein